MKTTITSAVSVTGLLLVLCACSEAEPLAPPPCDIANPKSCPEGLVCSNTQGSCSGGFCFFCSYYCEGTSCQQRCTE